MHPRAAVAALIAYAAAVTFPHENVQWAVNELAIRITHPRVYALFAGIVLTLGIALTAILFRGPIGPQSGVARRAWIAAILLIFGAWGTLTANNVELVHYPQYFPEGAALTALTLSPPEALAYVAIFGGLDEANQYWFLSHGRPTLLDFNDIYMDVVGGAAGIAFAMAFLSGARRKERMRPLEALKRPGLVALSSITVTGILLWAAGLMLIVEDKANAHYWFSLGRFRAPSFWAQIIANGPNRYHTFTPAEGIVVIWCTIAAIAAMCGGIVLKLADSPTAK